MSRSTWFTETEQEGKDYDDPKFHREFVRINEVVRAGKVEKVLEFGARKTDAEGIYLRETHPRSGQCLVFESEFLLDIDETTAEKVCKLGAAPILYFNLGKSLQYNNGPASDPNYTGSELARIYVNKDSSGKLRYFFNAPVSKAYMACTSAAEITEGWHTITMEMFSNGQVKYYVDGNLLGEAKVLSSQDVMKFSEMNSVKLSINDTLDYSSFFLDNTYLAWMDITYVPTKPDSGSDEEGGEGGGNSGDVDSPFDDGDIFDGGWS